MRYRKGNNRQLFENKLQIIVSIHVNSQPFSFQAIENGVDKHKEDLDGAKATVQEIIEVSEDPVLESELKSQLAQAADPLEKLGEKLNERKGKLEAVISQSGEFEKDLDEFQRWLTKTERTVAELRPASADPDTVKNQKVAFEVSGTSPDLCSVYQRK